ncbi:hypothetical protein ASPCADRAFT_205482 [Aspergillus carbonarius ITEM 5010]|uniref:Uncharacterized protein n=1 Tax=Aspergillus carbonarius (strain ITEM 5010) TaxID=602072 RepID=A0A1R3RUP1_ASPC5|nr:hypothetical protein ASPCADRAFT_205482 [Aspergillus carbonarius ITEM 5010]
MPSSRHENRAGKHCQAAWCRVYDSLTQPGTDNAAGYIDCLAAFRAYGQPSDIMIQEPLFAWPDRLHLPMPRGVIGQ